MNQWPRFKSPLPLLRGALAARCVRVAHVSIDGGGGGAARLRTWRTCASAAAANGRPVGRCAAAAAAAILLVKVDVAWLSVCCPAFMDGAEEWRKEEGEMS